MWSVCTGMRASATLIHTPMPYWQSFYNFVFFLFSIFSWTNFHPAQFSTTVCFWRWSVCRTYFVSLKPEQNYDLIPSERAREYGRLFRSSTYAPSHDNSELIETEINIGHLNSNNLRYFFTPGWRMFHNHCHSVTCTCRLHNYLSLRWFTMNVSRWVFYVSNSTDSEQSIWMLRWVNRVCHNITTASNA